MNELLIRLNELEQEKRKLEQELLVERESVKRHELLSKIAALRREIVHLSVALKVARLEQLQKEFAR